MPPPSLSVKLVSGQGIEVIDPIEAAWFCSTRDAYMADTKFTEATDLRDLDRLLVLELMVFRWTQWLSKGRTYDGDITDDEQLRRNIREFSDSINKVKDSMGLNKKAREAAANDGNWQGWLEDLKRRAKLFGIHREKQATAAMTLIKEIFTVTDTYTRADDEERQKFGYKTEADIVKWIQDDVRPRFDAIDEYFINTEQRYWVRDNV